MRAIMGAAMLLVACTHHRDIREAHEVEGDVEVQIAGRQTVDAVAVPAAGGTAFVGKYGGGPIAPAYVSKVVDTRRGRGALEGLGIGALIGGATGAMVGLADGDDSGGLFAMSAEEKAVVVGVVFGLVGGFTGLIVGAIKGSTIIYEHKASGTVVRPNGPPGSVAGVSVSF